MALRMGVGNPGRVVRFREIVDAIVGSLRIEELRVRELRTRNA
jgi:hypothetical protein